LLSSTLTHYPFRLEKKRGGIHILFHSTTQLTHPFPHYLLPSLSPCFLFPRFPPLPSFLPHLLCDGSPLVLEILAHFEDSGDWQQAFFKTLPERKVSPSCCSAHGNSGLGRDLPAHAGVPHLHATHTNTPRIHAPAPTYAQLTPRTLQGAVKPGERLPQEASLTIPTVREDNALSNSAPAFSHDKQQKVGIYFHMQLIQPHLPPPQNTHNAFSLHRLWQSIAKSLTPATACAEHRYARRLSPRGAASGRQRWAAHASTCMSQPARWSRTRERRQNNQVLQPPLLAE